MKTTSFKVPDELDALIDKWVDSHPGMNRTDCIVLALGAFLINGES